jgi:hypothetical protein
VANGNLAQLSAALDALVEQTIAAKALADSAAGLTPEVEARPLLGEAEEEEAEPGPEVGGLERPECAAAETDTFRLLGELKSFGAAYTRSGPPTAAQVTLLEAFLTRGNANIETLKKCNLGLKDQLDDFGRDLGVSIMYLTRQGGGPRTMRQSSRAYTDFTKYLHEILGYPGD